MLALRRISSLSITPFSSKSLRTRYLTMGAIGAQTVDTTERLAKLRELMGQKYSVNAYVVPSEDQRASHS